MARRFLLKPRLLAKHRAGCRAERWRDPRHDQVPHGHRRVACSRIEDAGRIAEEEGCAAVALHARTAAQLYDGEAQWDAIAGLKKHVRTIPVLGNGDIWEAHDALRMMRSTGCDGVVIGRGCLGRPWLFRDLADVFEGREPQNPPTFGEVAEIALEHATLLE